MSDQELQAAEPARERTRCTECQSVQVRASRSSYPRDTEKTADGTSSFWRCGNCGARFLGPLAPEESAKRHRKAARIEQSAALDRRIRRFRSQKKWIYPVLAILSTIVAVIYLLDRRDPPQPQLILPES